MPTCLKCLKKFPNWNRINGIWRNLCSRKYCLDCSPYKLHNTKKIHLINEATVKVCSECKKEKPLNEFYLKNKDGELKHMYCKSCCSNRTLRRQYKLKKEAVLYKGGCCALCGYDKYYGALDFHHVDPKTKEFEISKFRLLKFNQIKKELDKCICVCKNCHSEIHAGIISDGIIIEIFNKLGIRTN